MPLSYKDVGVNYDELDPFKCAAMEAARQTAKNAVRLRMLELVASRGESAYIVETDDAYYAHVEEGLGTKNLVADAMEKLTGKCFYASIAQDTVAMIVNDMVTVGAMPVSVAMHLAVGDGAWFKNARRCMELIVGWKHACDLARCNWGGGETPTLKGVVMPEAAVLSGSAFGIIRPKERLIRDRIEAGDAILFIGGSGIHANGLTLARKIAEPEGYPDRLPAGRYLDKLTDGRTYGESLLDPTPIYVELIEQCLNAGVFIHYAVNVTGHGWRKLMRSPQPFAYVIERIPKPQPVFAFMQEHGPITDLEAYANLNMGAGFALILPPESVPAVERIAADLGHTTLHAGEVEQSSERKVEILPLNLVYETTSLKLR